ncbi:MAG: restriction alleviation protein, Lar family [Mesorhizobium sp.]|uniref:Lar family restriction alleviation protein n=1 Tax=Mesorhizobium sp. TaxID=1871066 RepID=UPI000FE74D91|nr:Lar family restriction alleviation protein [Mesorhizobium sp.]RWL14852.1 MAG: restriction alleviation protein, Lar family [Mesorhizobium sp.]
MTNLLPCPFCGGKAETVHIEEGENAGGSCVCCEQCMASSNVEFEFKENFVSNWNRRAPQLSIEVERVDCVTWKNGFQEEAGDFWRIVLDGYCADFPTETAAKNFADAIKRCGAQGPTADTYAEAERLWNARADKRDGDDN